MCGISGFVRFGTTGRSGLLQRLTAPLRHRGPEDEGYALWEAGGERLQAYSGEDTQPDLDPQLPGLPTDIESRAGLGFRRLAIQDLSACGHQPMLSDDGMVALTFNGEIFNFRELRQRLEREGIRFASRSDTEVILRGYLRFGISWIEQLSGMFAVAILDLRAGAAYLIRDRLGIKPLFVHSAPHGIYWASEAKALVDAGIFKPAPDWTGLASTFSLQAPMLPQTCFTGVEMVEPGTFWKIDLTSGGRATVRYWSIPYNSASIQISAQEAAEEAEHRLRAATEAHLVADVPVAVLMSGGLDSTLIAAFAREAAPVEAFTLSLDGRGEGLDETPQASAVARHLGVKHTIVRFDQRKFLDALPDSLANAEAPYLFLEPVEYAARALHEAGYKVVLTGLGADEVFGGYGFYAGYEQWRRRRWMAGPALFIPPLTEKLRKLQAALDIRDAVDYWAYNRVGLKEHELTRLLNSPAARTQASLLHEGPDEGRGSKATLFYLDLWHNVGAHHSLREDASYMAHSVESRYPFLDHGLVEWVASLPLSIRYGPGVTKPLLRRVAEKHLPLQVLSMPKKGFNLPFGGELWDDPFFAGLCRDHIVRLQGRGLLSAKVLEGWWNRRREPYYFHRTWLAVTFEAWWRRFPDGAAGAKI